MTTRTKPPIVAFAHHPWDEPEWMNRQQLLSRLGKLGWSVAYTHGTLDWWQRGSPVWQASPLFNRIIDRDHIRDIIPGRLGARWRRYPTFDRFQMARHAKFVRAAVAKPNERIIALLFDPQFYPYIEHLQPCDVAFHAYDVYAHQSNWTDQKEKFQSDLLREASLVTASSAPIARHLKRPNVHVIPNGADVDAFANASNLPEPKDLTSIPHPRIAYVGAINRKVDLPLIEFIAKKHPEWHWVLVGRIEEKEILQEEFTAAAFKSCLQLPNIHFLGQKDRREVPAYVGNMDINTMCYRGKGNGWWSARSPLKLYEYLSAGLPVISTPLESIKDHANIITLCDTPYEWIEAIKCNLKINNQEKYSQGIRIASENSWDAKSLELSKLLLIAADLNPSHQP